MKEKNSDPEFNEGIGPPPPMGTDEYRAWNRKRMRYKRAQPDYKERQNIASRKRTEMFNIGKENAEVEEEWTNTKYREHYPERLIRHMADGMSFEAFGSVISVGRTTMYDWLGEHPAWRKAKEVGELKCLFYWEKLGKMGAIQPKSFNAAAWIFTMKNRFKWQDVNSPDGLMPGSGAGQLTGSQIVELVKLARAEKEKLVIPIPEKNDK